MNGNHTHADYPGDENRDPQPKPCGVDPVPPIEPILDQMDVAGCIILQHPLCVLATLFTISEKLMSIYRHNFPPREGTAV